jgi:hypothetical protein
MIADLSHRAASIGCSPSTLVLMPWSSETPPRRNSASPHSLRLFPPPVQKESKETSGKTSVRLEQHMGIRRMTQERIFLCRFTKLGESFPHSVLLLDESLIARLGRHMVPHDQSKSALDLIERWLKYRPLMLEERFIRVDLIYCILGKDNRRHNRFAFVLMGLWTLCH